LGNVLLNRGDVRIIAPAWALGSLDAIRVQARQADFGRDGIDQVEPSASFGTAIFERIPQWPKSSEGLTEQFFID
jgi:hypothetical protein